MENPIFDYRLVEFSYFSDSVEIFFLKFVLCIAFCSATEHYDSSTELPIHIRKIVMHFIPVCVNFNSVIIVVIDSDLFLMSSVTVCTEFHHITEFKHLINWKIMNISILSYTYDSRYDIEK